mmetsp:Transcript_14706/g.26332  ORF Transcript_14706/g.26332 Transcript_14706/m.26332 type:complete len:84 (+) Transcript_14706:196-447(+)
MGGHGDAAPARTVSLEEMKREKVPIENRDNCVHLLIPLNRCRRKTNWLMWECDHERHAYEKCQYDEYHRRMDLMEKQLKETKK